MNTRVVSFFQFHSYAVTSDFRSTIELCVSHHVWYCW